MIRGRAQTSLYRLGDSAGEPMDATISAVVGALVGVVGGWGLSYVTERRAERRQARQQLALAALVVADRLTRIKHAIEKSDPSQTEREFWFLGGDVNDYRDAVARADRTGRDEHWRIYEQLIPVLLDHDLEALGRVAARLAEHPELIEGSRHRR